jgi:hypothetical protein
VSPAPDRPDGLIWATRGRTWGFRFLLDAGLADPLETFERAFAGLGDDPTAWRRAAGQVALRFPDPPKRRDSAGRVIPHHFVVFGPLVEGVDSLEAGVKQIWPLVAPAYAQVWDADDPPSGTDLRFTTTGGLG